MKYLLTVTLMLVTFSMGWLLRYLFSNRSEVRSPIETIQELQRPLNKYNFDDLIKADIAPGTININDQISKNEKYTSYKFNYIFNPSLDKSISNMTSGQINIPTQNIVTVKRAIIVMFRGYIDQTIFNTGDGTRRAAEKLAENGYITIAPDFLGYGDSDPVADNIFESRFQTYVTALSLIKSLENLTKYPNLISGPSDITYLLTKQSQPIYLWGHSNGGQIAITVLELTGKPYPTSLWAPVTKPFPYSVLYYTDQSEDGGKLIRKELADFEALYDVDRYSLTNYLDRIHAPIVLHQGTTDDAVPLAWSNSFVNKIKETNKDIKFYTYPATDHNMRPAWDTVVARDIEFYDSHFQ